MQRGISDIIYLYRDCSAGQNQFGVLRLGAAFIRRALARLLECI